MHLTFIRVARKGSDMDSQVKKTKSNLPGAGPGRPKGIPNKATQSAREAIAAFVDGNAHRLTEWLDQVAQDNPAKAFEMFQSVVEYHIPKLARTEVTGDGGGPVVVALSPLDERL